MSHRPLLVTGLIVVGLFVISLSALFAAPNRDHTPDREEALAALEVLNTYFNGSVPTLAPAVPTPTPSPTSTPAPTSTPEPTATATPLPKPTPLPVLAECRERHDGWFYGGSLLENFPWLRVVDQRAQHIDVTFINPPNHWWSYGFAYKEDRAGQLEEQDATSLWNSQAMVNGF